MCRVIIQILLLVLAIRLFHAIFISIFDYHAFLI